MILDSEAATHLKPWLVRTLEPICDAEPGALADYILALLRHNAPEADLRQELLAQLEEFLEKETSPFFQTLFTSLRTKSYMPYSAPSPPASPSAPSNSAMDSGIPIPLDLVTPSEGVTPDRRRKRSPDNDVRDFRPPKGPRLSDDGQFQRFGGPGRGTWGARGERGGRMNIPGRADYMDGGVEPVMHMNMGGGMLMNGRSAYRPPERNRGICRDYYNNGYCARGAYCKYSHGEDAVVPGQLFPMNGMNSFAPMMPFPMPMPPNPQYNPHERIDMRPMAGPGMSMNMGAGRLPNARAPTLPRQAEMNGSVALKAGELPVIQDLTPRPLSEEQAMSIPPTRQGSDMPIPQESMSSPSQADIDMSVPQNPIGGGRGGFRPSRGGGRGTFGDAASFRPERRNDKTLVVEKIPEDKLSLGAINDWFKKFGTVTNVAVDTSSSKALVSFANHQEAYTAWKSEDAVFGNRFVKVFWHRPMEGHGQKGTRLLAASADLVAKVATKDSVSPASPSPADAPRPVVQRKSAPTSSTASALAAKQQQLEQRIAQQKLLMSKLAMAEALEKKEILEQLRELNKPIPIGSPASTSATPTRSSMSTSDGQEVNERERLDKELELHSAVTAAEGEGEESTDELKARLAKLKAEAASLGISEGAAEQPPAYNGTGYRPYRGRGRGGRGYRGGMRGGPPPRASMKLDNRPKKLLVKGATSDQLQGVRDWYETTGQVDSVETTESGDVLVSFKSRSAAEQGFAKGTSIPTVGIVQVSWFTGQPAAPTKQAPPATSDNVEMKDDLPRAPSPSIARDEDTRDEEEVAVSGWGAGDGEDDFGMM